MQIGLDWIKYHTPYRAGGLEDQPLQLWRDVRSAINTYQAIRLWKDVEQLDGERFEKYLSGNPELVKFMQYIWSLQKNASDG